MKIRNHNPNTGLIEVRDLPYKPFQKFQVKMLVSDYWHGVLRGEVVDACFAPDGKIYLHHVSGVNKGIVFNNDARLGKDCELLK